MCGRYLLLAPVDAIERLFDIRAETNLQPRYNIAPRQVIMTIRAGDPSGGPLPRHLRPVEWGLVPAWSKQIPTRPMINTRIETALEKPSFRSAVMRRRCLIPATGWYEWATRGGHKQPYAIRADEAACNGDFIGEEGLFAFAGLWETWAGPDGGDDYQTAAILTQDAVGPLAQVHHRRPVIVPRAQYEEWLAPHDPLPKGFLDRFQNGSEEGFVISPAHAKVGNVRFDSPDCLVSQADAPGAGQATDTPSQGELF